MNTALALKICEAPNTAAAGGQAQKTEAGEKTPDTTESFKKKLEECEAVVTPMQSATTSGSITNTDDGMQNGLGAGMPETDCIIEGSEIPNHPPDVAEPQNEAVNMAAMTIPNSMAEGEQTDKTSHNAWMQHAMAGDTPVQTQDQILETIGTYLDGAESGRQKPGTLAPRDLETAPSVSAEKTTTEATGSSENVVNREGAANRESAAGNMATGGLSEVQRPVTPEAATEKLVVTAADTAGKREAEAVPSDPGQPQGVSTLGDCARETVPVAGEATAGTETEETAQLTKDNVLRIVDKVATKSADGRYELDVELKPDFLGKVHIKLTMEDGNIRMQIKTDDVSVKGMLSDQSASLQTALKEKGITLTNVNVTYESQTARDFSQQPHEQNGSGRQGLYYAQTEAIGFEPEEQLYSYYTGSSSVEFLA